MALDPEDLLAQAKEYERLAKKLRETYKAMRGLNRSIEGIVEGQPVRRPDAWRTADDIELLLEHGNKAMPSGELLKALADQNLVGGETYDDRISSGRKALTRGVNIGYLAIEDDVVRWIPGIRVNSRLGRKKK